MFVRLFVALALANLAACTAYDRRDAAWSRPYHQKFDQIPNQPGEALRRCGGQVRPELRTPEMTDRC